MRNGNGNIVWHEGGVSAADRGCLNGHAGGVIWFTGLSGAGKSTLAYALEADFHAKGVRSYVLDGDNVRHGLSVNLGFSHEDRMENLRRAAEAAKLFADAGMVAMAAFITPMQIERRMIRNILAGFKYAEVYVRCDIKECIRRDPKGMYEKALKNVIKEYTGISSPYEEPENPDLIIDTAGDTVRECVGALIGYVERIGFLRSD
jgi:adenylylsulfate kinase